MHATGITNFDTSISQIHDYSTSMALIPPSSYLKTIIKNQTSHSIQCTLYESFFIISFLDAHHIRTKFITKGNYHVVLKDYQNNISEAWDFINFFKIKPLSCSKKISEAIEQMTNYSKRYKWRSMSSWIIMQLCEDSLEFTNFRSWDIIQTANKTK